jgi:hypothetical protein
MPSGCIAISKAVGAGKAAKKAERFYKQVPPSRVGWRLTPMQALDFHL